MKVHYKFTFENMIRLGSMLSLIFFAFVPGISCSDKNKEEISLVWENKKAKAISVSQHLLNEDDFASIRQNLLVHLKGQPTAILGDYLLISDHIQFTPAFPFTPGKEYEVVYKQKLLKQFLIPFPDSADAPRLLGLYPSADTLPENVLKLYLNFSAPMREGESMKHLSLVSNKGDTLRDIFLDLQPELWNPERNVLTVWFDPGRIKRDLIPNLKMGYPLKNGGAYTLIVSSDWQDARGLSLKEVYRRNFVIENRDSISPDPKNWKISLPVAGTKEPLKITFPESLDYFLLQEVINVTDNQGRVVPGSIRIAAKELGIDFYPQTKWAEGDYHLKVGSHLEDLAGNNINRLFEQDFKQSKSDKGKRFIEITCKIISPGNP
jgi:hypothetical protein